MQHPTSELERENALLREALAELEAEARQAQAAANYAGELSITLTKERNEAQARVAELKERCRQLEEGILPANPERCGVL